MPLPSSVLGKGTVMICAILAAGKSIFIHTDSVWSVKMRVTRHCKRCNAELSDIGIRTKPKIYCSVCREISRMEKKWERLGVQT